uniref:Uncharacterized protein n=1 Tax=Geospiza parvula TaxID=87175 RepID=A0A8C3MN36_GEOPR
STGEIRVVGPLDSQQHKSYRLVVRLTDTHHDLDPRKRQSRLCDVSVQTLPKEPLVVLQTEAVWHPPAWFVAVLTISGVLLLATLGCTARSLTRGMFNILCIWPWLAVLGSPLCPGQGCSPDGGYGSRENNLASRP